MSRPPTRYWIDPETADSDGLVGIGGDLAPATLLRAYRDGVFPWFNPDDPILWWSPDPRAIIEIGQVYRSRRLARTMRSPRFEVSIDSAFRQVMLGCADRAEGSWITDAILESYCQLHELGYAHSVEVWHQGRLVGGTYGVAIGAFFAAESMFHYVTDASKVALVSLDRLLQQRGFLLLDIQIISDHTRRMGAIEVPRTEYLRRLRLACREPARWAVVPLRQRPC